MYKIEIIGESLLYIKAMGRFPESIAKQFVQDFKEKTKGLEKISAIIDGLDFILLAMKSFDIILKLLKENNSKLIKAAYVSKSPVVVKEFELLLERAESPNRIVVDNLDAAKKWIGIEDIVFRKD